ncbi:hypothetical protein VPH35_082121 [Triticum aestivum]
MRKMGKTDPPMLTGKFLRVLSWEEARQSSSTGEDEGRGRGQRRGGGRRYACGHRLPRRRTGRFRFLSFLASMTCSASSACRDEERALLLAWTDGMICTREQQVEEIQSQFRSAVASSIDNKTAQQPNVVKRRKREHWRKRQQDRFSKLSHMFEQLEDSYNHFSLALLNLDVNRLWKSYNCEGVYTSTTNSHDPITVCCNDKIEQLLLE